MPGRKPGVKNTPESRLRRGAELRNCKVCGAEIWIAKWQRERDPSAGQFCSRMCKHDSMRGKSLNINPRGPERVIRSDGYVALWMPEHPKAHKGRVLEHIAVVELALGRPLEPGEQVHHLNRDRADNRLENLEVVWAADHIREHARDPEWRKQLAANARRQNRLRDPGTGRFLPDPKG